jgi:hypothetical protein
LRRVNTSTSERGHNSLTTGERYPVFVEGAGEVYCSVDALTVKGSDGAFYEYRRGWPLSLVAHLDLTAARLHPTCEVRFCCQRANEDAPKSP